MLKFCCPPRGHLFLSGSYSSSSVTCSEVFIWFVTLFPKSDAQQSEPQNCSGDQSAEVQQRRIKNKDASVQRNQRCLGEGFDGVVFV